MTEIYLIRHGVTENNMQGVFQGLTDAPLSEMGLKQADCLGERFREIEIDAVYSSPLLRAVQTAQGANKYKRLPIRLCHDIIEINGGELEGKTMEENRLLYPEAIKAMESSPGIFAAPGGESMKQVYERVGTAMTDIARSHNGQKVMVVSHGGAIMTFLHFITGLPIEKMGTGMVENTAVNKFVYNPQTNLFIVDYQADISHLPEKFHTSVAHMYRMEEKEK